MHIGESELAVLNSGSATRSGVTCWFALGGGIALDCGFYDQSRFTRAFRTASAMRLPQGLVKTNEARSADFSRRVSSG
ncbi:hypothetical protein HQ447_04895 [bacterium]|nr:hypothetical protein [bacterium]